VYETFVELSWGEIKEANGPGFPDKYFIHPSKSSVEDYVHKEITIFCSDNTNQSQNIHGVTPVKRATMFS